MLPFESHRPRRDRSARRRPALSPVESLEGRQLLTYTPLGFSSPDLVVSGQAPVVAAYGGPMTVSVDVFNTAQSSIIEPTNLTQTSPSYADAGPTVVGVYLSTNPHHLTGRSIRVGEIAVPSVVQNSSVQLTQTFTLPDRPAGFPPNGRNLYVYFRADDLHQIIDIDRTNNLSRAPEPMQLAAPLPELAATAIQVPPVMQPGDVISPAFILSNLGTTGIPPQGPLLVQLVASTDQNYGPTDVVLASYTIDNIDPLSMVPAQGPNVLEQGIDTQANQLVISGPNVQLPVGTGSYYIGLVVDPLNQIRELSEVGRLPTPALEQVRLVQPVAGLPPAGQLTSPAPGLNVFPIPPFGPIYSSFQPPGTVIPTATTLGGASASGSTARGMNGWRLRGLINTPAAPTRNGPARLPQMQVPGGPRLFGRNRPGLGA